MHRYTDAHLPLIGMCVKRRALPQPVQLEDVPDTDGVIEALVTPGLPGRMTPAAAGRILDIDAAHRGLEPPGRWAAYPA